MIKGKPGSVKYQNKWANRRERFGNYLTHILQLKVTVLAEMFCELCLEWGPPSLMRTIG
jgi:hypothetical protein